MNNDFSTLLVNHTHTHTHTDLVHSLPMFIFAFYVRMRTMNLIKTCLLKLDEEQFRLSKSEKEPYGTRNNVKTTKFISASSEWRIREESN